MNYGESQIKGRTTEGITSKEGLIVETRAAGTESRDEPRRAQGARRDWLWEPGQREPKSPGLRSDLVSVPAGVRSHAGDTSRPAEDSGVLASDRLVPCARWIAAVGSGEHRAIGAQEKTAAFVRDLPDARVSLRSFWVFGTR